LVEHSSWKKFKWYQAWRRIEMKTGFRLEVFVEQVVVDFVAASDEALVS